MSLPALLLISFAVVAPGNAMVIALDGQELRGRIAGWSDAVVAVETQEGRQEIAVEKLLRIQWSRSAELAPIRATAELAPIRATAELAPIRATAELVDGSRMPCDRYLVADGVATLQLPATGAVQSLPVAAIRQVEMEPRAETLDAMWAEIDEKELVGDVLVIRKRPKDGQQPALDYLAGVVRSVDAERVDFVWDGEPIPVARKKVAAIRYYRPDAPEKNDATFTLETVDGASLVVRRLQFEQHDIAIETAAGLRTKIPLSELRAADYSQGKLVYLSDLEPIAVKWTPYIGLPPGAGFVQAFGLPRQDHAYHGSALTLLTTGENGARTIQSFRKGLAIRSRTELVYQVPRKMTKFVALAGIDPESSDQGRVTLEVYADRKLLWQGEIDGSKDPRTIDVDISGARRLRLLVDYGENLDYGDRLHLAEARVLK